MTTMPLDEYGDMMPVKTKADTVTGSDAVTSVVASRLRFYKGEWFEDPEAGFSLPTFLANKLQNGLRSEDDIEAVVSYVTAYVMKSMGVSSIASKWYNVSNRELSIQLTLITDDGESAEGRVSMHELLGAASE